MLQISVIYLFAVVVVGIAFCQVYIEWKALRLLQKQLHGGTDAVEHNDTVKPKHREMNKTIVMRS